MSAGPTGGQTALQVRYRPTIVGQEKIHIHVIDTDTKELVSDDRHRAVTKQTR